MESLSHSTKIPSTVTPTGLSGPDALRAYFAPRQVLRLKESAECLGMSYSHFFRRVQSGTLDLKIRKNEVGERFVLLDDLIQYLYPDDTSTEHQSEAKRKKVGRPRKSVTSDGQKGGTK